MTADNNALITQVTTWCATLREELATDDTDENGSSVFIRVICGNF